MIAYITIKHILPDFPINNNSVITRFQFVNASNPVPSIDHKLRAITGIRRMLHVLIYRTYCSKHLFNVTFIVCWSTHVDCRLTYPVLFFWFRGIYSMLLLSDSRSSKNKLIHPANLKASSKFVFFSSEISNFVFSVTTLLTKRYQNIKRYFLETKLFYFYRK